MKIFTLKSVALLAALAGSLATATVSAQERVRISFVRAGATADEVAVLLSDEDGQPIPGAKATLTLSHELKTTGTAVTPSVLCPDANATGGQDVTFQLDITGLEPGFAFDRVQLEAHALNSSGAYQAEGQVFDDFGLADTGRADQLAAGSTSQITRLADGSSNAQFTCIGQSQLNLCFRANRPQNGHLHGTLGAYHFDFLVGGELARLRKVFFIAENSACSKQGFQILLGNVQMTGRSFYHYFHLEHSYYIKFCLPDEWLFAFYFTPKFRRFQPFPAKKAISSLYLHFITPKSGNGFSCPFML